VLSIRETDPAERVLHFLRLAARGEDIFWSQFGLMRRDVLARTPVMGLYNGADQVLLMELASQGTFEQIPDELFFRREHDKASTVRGGWSARTRARFMWADDRRTLVFPYCRLLSEHLASLRRASMPRWSKVRCAVAIVKRFSPQWKQFAHELVESPIEIWRESQEFSG